jgi:3-oxoacyl-[acyl-carrier-protein] synthase II
MGTVTPYGVGVDTYWQNIIRGTTAARPIAGFDVTRLPTRFGAQVPLVEAELDRLLENPKSAKTMSRASKFAVIAASDAVRDAGIDTARLDPFRMGTSLGVGGVGLWDLDYTNKLFDVVGRSVRDAGESPDHGVVWKDFLDGIHPLTPLRGLPNMAAAHIAINHNARGHCQTTCTACTASAQAIGEAYRKIESGVADIMIAGGSDSMINPHGIVAFSMLGVMTQNNDEYQTASRPFDKRRDGFMLGEGAAIFILEELEHSRSRGARSHGELIGYANTSDAFRLTDEPPEAWGTIEAMRLALTDAGLEAGDIDYINAHGTATPMNDRTETRAIRHVFETHADAIPVSSTKSMIGHLVAAAGAVEFAASVEALKHQVIPPTINYECPDSECDLDYVPNTAREQRIKVVLSNSFGFGGQNACLIVRSPDQ